MINKQEINTDVIVFNPKYNDLLVKVIVVFIFIFFLVLIQKDNLSETITFLTKRMLPVLAIMSASVIILQFKKVTIIGKKIIIERVVLRTKNVFFKKDIQQVNEIKFPFHSGFNHLLIKANNRNYRIFYVYISRYKSLKKEFFSKQ